MNIARAAAMVALPVALAVAGCSGGFGGPKRPQPTVAVDPNAYPASYRQQIAALLAPILTDRADFHGTLIAAPALKPVAESQNPHYVVCLQLNGHNEHKTKAVIYLAGVPTQYIDATTQQCGDAAYLPFTELESAMPSK